MGYRQVLAVGLPLVVSMGSMTVAQFTDRVFLSGYSLDAIAASLPAGIAQFLFTSFFMGIAGYVNVFVAQYTGAGRPRRVGAALWQGIWLALASWLLMSLLWFVAPLFEHLGHPPAVVAQEMTYFRILVLGSGLVVTAATLGCFYSGRGLTRPIMVVNIIASLSNIPLDYAMIYGVGPFPEMGIAGAGIATVISWAMNVILYLPLIFRRRNQKVYGVLGNWRLEPKLFARMLRFGLPGGVQFFLDIFAITFFIFMIGRLGPVPLAASNIVLSINHISFLPMIGMSIAVSTLVGQAMGARDVALARRAASNALHLTMGYMGLMALVMVTLPGPLMAIFRTHGIAEADWGPILELGRVLLVFVALFTLLDAMAITFSGALKGAGDIRYIMWLMAAASAGAMVLPLYVGIERLGLGLYFAWVCISVYATTLGLCMMLRWRGKAWQEIEVVERAPAGAGQE